MGIRASGPPVRRASRGDGGPVGGLKAALAPVVRRALGLETLDRLRRAARNGDPLRGFPGSALDVLGVRINGGGEAGERIPATGPVVVVANHPFGGLDGLALLDLLRRVRSDVRVLANRLLAAIPEIAGACIFVETFGGQAAARSNVIALRHAVAHVRAGGLLAIFPAGEVSSLRLLRRRVEDPPWNPFCARLALEAGAPVVPLGFDGRNSGLFQATGLVHPRLRTLLLPRELLARRRSEVRVRIGRAVAPERLARLPSPDAMARYLRARTYAVTRGGIRRTMSDAHARRSVAPIDPPGDSGAIAAEMERLPAERWLASSGSLSVAWAGADEIPAVLSEIATLRETAFRAVGEGTGRSRDTDRFDATYLHLVLWDRAERSVAGAYRMGPLDAVPRRRGRPDVYTRSLFRIDGAFFDALGPALELGRSFIRPDRQRDYAPLLLLWKGIGRFVAAHPRYRHLFGAVSMSHACDPRSRDIVAAFLGQPDRMSPLAGHVAPRTPYAPLADAEARFLRGAGLPRNLDELDEVVRDIEADQRAVPVLLRQYLKLDARVLGLNVDQAFSDTLDALMVVDLVSVDRRILARTMGEDGAGAFLRTAGEGAGLRTPALSGN